MKYIKNIELFEGRTYKNLAKYSNYIKTKFDAYKVIVFEENGQNCLHLIYHGVSKEKMLFLCDIFRDVDFRLNPPISYAPENRFVIFDIPQSFFDQLDLEMTAQKYNL